MSAADTASSFSRVAGSIAAGIPPSSTSRSIARTPMPPPLVRIASRFPGGAVDAPQRLGAVKQLAKIRYPQDSGATERGIVDRVRTGQRAGMGRGGLCPLRHAPGFDDHDRLDPRGGTRRRHEFAGVLDRFDIEHDGAGLAVQREIIEQIGDIDVELVADETIPENPTPRCAAQSTMPAAMAPDWEISARVSHCGHMRGETRIEGGAGHHDAEAIRSDQPHSEFVRGAPGGFRQSEPAPWPSPAETITTPAAPSPPASSTISATATAGAVITTSSGTKGNLARGCRRRQRRRFRHNASSPGRIRP